MKEWAQGIQRYKGLGDEREQYETTMDPSFRTLRQVTMTVWPSR
jgi:DNA gyrase/topoisomerase IV subunit B